MATRLSRIYGTEQDRVNCPFYFKIGACRHGAKCTRRHNKPTESQSILYPALYRTPFNRLIQFGDVEGETEAQKHFEEFYEDVFVELAQFGVIEELHVCQNLGAHLNGNVYVKYETEEDASNALQHTNGRYYDGVKIEGELSPVTDFKEARCRQYDVGECKRGGYCNFMHLREPNKELKMNLFTWQRHYWKEKGRVSPSRSRSPSSRSRSRSRERRRYRSRSRERRRDRSRSHERRRDRSRSRDRGRDRSRSDSRRRSRKKRERSRSDSRDRRSRKYSKRRDSASPSSRERYGDDGERNGGKE